MEFDALFSALTLSDMPIDAKVVFFGLLLDTRHRQLGYRLSAEERFAANEKWHRETRGALLDTFRARMIEMDTKAADLRAEISVLNKEAKRLSAETIQVLEAAVQERDAKLFELGTVLELIAAKETGTIIVRQ